MNIIGKGIREKRIQAKLTQIELAEKTGIMGSTISKYERGVLNPKIETLKTIADALGCRWMDFLPMPADAEEYVIKMDDRGIRYLSKGEAEAEEATDKTQEKIDTTYINKLAVPALKLNEIGRKVLLDNAESLAANEDMTK